MRGEFLGLRQIVMSTAALDRQVNDTHLAAFLGCEVGVVHPHQSKKVCTLNFA